MATYISKLKKKSDSTWYDIFAARAECDKNGNVIASTYYTKIEAQQTVKLSGDQSIAGKKKFTGTVVLSENFRGQVGGKETGDLFFSSTAGGAIMTNADMADYVGVVTDQTISGTKTFTNVITAKTSSATAEGLTVDYTTKVGETTSSTNAHSAMTLTPQTLIKETLTANYTYSWPNKSGTVALTSDIPSLDGYLLASTASNTYLTKTDASNTYLTKASASSTYATTSALNSVKSQLENYVTTSVFNNTIDNYAALRETNTFTKGQIIKLSGLMSANMSAGDGLLSLQNNYNNATTTLEIQPSWPPKMTGTRKTTATSLQYYDYNFPTKSGTLATTSDLNNYATFASFSASTTSNFGGSIGIRNGSGQQLFIETDTISPTASGNAAWHSYTVTLDRSAPSNRYVVVANQSYSSYGSAVCKTSNRNTTNFTLFAYNVENNNPTGSWARQYGFILIDIGNV